MGMAALSLAEEALANGKKKDAMQQSNRAKQMLPQLGIIHGGAEAQGVAAVLDAAAMTYVAGTITALMTLLYYVSLIFGGRRN